MENFTLNTMVAVAKERGYHRIIGEYLPTIKNKMVERHYQDLGFEKYNAPTEQFVLDLNSYQNRECFIKRK
jgi:predicted enzyme involved in methoxymalonyl-ACP biosynthesis